MATQPLDESTATLVALEEHLGPKDFLTTPTKISHGGSSGTASADEPSTPEAPAHDSVAPVSIGSDAGARLFSKLVGPEPTGQPPWGTQRVVAPADNRGSQPEPDGDRGTPGWPNVDRPGKGGETQGNGGNPGWPNIAKASNGGETQGNGGNPGWPNIAKASNGGETQGNGGNPGWPNIAKASNGGETQGDGGHPGWPNFAKTDQRPSLPEGDNGNMFPGLATDGQGPGHAAALATEGPEGQPPWGSQKFAANGGDPLAHPNVTASSASGVDDKPLENSFDNDLFRANVAAASNSGGNEPEPLGDAHRPDPASARNLEGNEPEPLGDAHRPDPASAHNLEGNEPKPLGDPHRPDPAFARNLGGDEPKPLGDPHRPDPASAHNLEGNEPKPLGDAHRPDPASARNLEGNEPKPAGDPHRPDPALAVNPATASTADDKSSA
ncbi:hypothetical protein PWT90_01198 [Aphanocladium album]|nr:hypothetical protein PWT90_01198 [Aphanocladium album]